jgi:hypothetical protein
MLSERRISLERSRPQPEDIAIIQFSMPKPIVDAVALEALVPKIRATGIISDDRFELRDRGETCDVQCSPEVASHILEAIERIPFEESELRLMCTGVIRTLLEQLETP